MEKGTAPLEIKIRATATTTNPKTASRYALNWHPNLCQLHWRNLMHDTATPPLPKGVSQLEHNGDLRMIKILGRRSFPRWVHCGSTLPPNPHSRSMPLSSKRPMLHSLSRETAPCGATDMFYMDELDLPATRDSHFRSPGSVDTGL